MAKNDRHMDRIKPLVILTKQTSIGMGGVGGGMDCGEVGEALG